VQVEQIRGTGEVVAMRQNHSALEKQLDTLQQLLVSEREARQIQWATRSRKSGPTGAVVPPPPPPPLPGLQLWGCEQPAATATGANVASPQWRFCVWASGLSGSGTRGA
jgi:hypothetical protein